MPPKKKPIDYRNKPDSYGRPPKRSDTSILAIFNDDTADDFEDIGRLPRPKEAIALACTTVILSPILAGLILAAQQNKALSLTDTHKFLLMCGNFVYFSLIYIFARHETEHQHNLIKFSQDQDTSRFALGTYTNRYLTIHNKQQRFSQDVSEKTAALLEAFDVTDELIETIKETTAEALYVLKNPKTELLSVDEWADIFAKRIQQNTEAIPFDNISQELSPIAPYAKMSKYIAAMKNTLLGLNKEIATSLPIHILQQIVEEVADVKLNKQQATALTNYVNAFKEYLSAEKNQKATFAGKITDQRQLLLRPTGLNQQSI